MRQLGDDAIVVVRHLSNAAQAVALDLRRVSIRIEMFGENIFPPGGEVPYLLTLGPYHFYCFRLPRI
jgi:maltose alpha-D-glucosyltransferase/alpha-amylase